MHILSHTAAVLVLATFVLLAACRSHPAADEPGGNAPNSPSASASSDTSSARSDSSATDTLAAGPDATAADSGAVASDSTSVDSTGQAPADTTHADSARTDTADVTVTPVYGYRVVNAYPHDPAAFTQGLVYADSVLYEGTGLYGQSTLRRVKLETGEVLASRSLPGQYFGEGIAVVRDSVYQITWRSGEGFVYRKDDFGPVGSVTYATEGWGLTWDGSRLVMSDGSATLYFRDPNTFQETGRVTVTDLAGPVQRLNELEYIDGEIYANVWFTDRIARIDPATGRVLSWIDLTGLLDPSERPSADAVLNGIAYDPVGKRLFVTGKWWPWLFEIEVSRQ